MSTKRYSQIIGKLGEGKRELGEKREVEGKVKEEGRRRRKHNL
jgi:hypothetical protein